LYKFNQTFTNVIIYSYQTKKTDRNIETAPNFACMNSVIFDYQ